MSAANLKMSKEVNMLTHSQVHKKIIERPPKIRAAHETLGPGNRYRDEIFEIYNKKRTQFLDLSKHYNRLNQETLMCNKMRTLDDYRAALNCNFLYEGNEDCSEDEESGQLIRKRTERPIHQVIEHENQPCTMEPWVRRHLKLNKFVWAARTMILKNRLLKVLEKLRTVTPEDIEALEMIELARFNVSYAEIFQQFF